MIKNLDQNWTKKARSKTHKKETCSFIRLIIREIDIDCKSGTIQVPVIVDGQPTFNVSYQHDLIIEKESDIKVIGFIKHQAKTALTRFSLTNFFITS